MATQRNPISPVSKRTSSLFTSANGVRASVVSVGASVLRSISLEEQFDSERYQQDDNHSQTRMSGARAARVSVYRPPQNSLEERRENNPLEQNPFDDRFGEPRQLEAENPFDDSNATEPTQQVATAPTQPVESEEPYSVFGPKEKWAIIIIIGVAGLFSGLSSNIYFPALDLIAKDLQVSVDTVSLTVTSYLIIQGISPVIWGSFSDALGRRPIYLASFAVYIIANIALSFSPNFAVLLIFRGIQAAGSASTVSIGNGVIQDISPPAERGAYISFYQAIRNFSIAVGPVLGGLISNFFGFRPIFIFLLILSSITIIIILFFLPETMRSIAGNGSLRLKGVYVPLIRKIKGEPEGLQDPDENMAPRKKVTIMTFIDPLKLLGEKDILSSLIFGGVVYTIWSMVTATTTTIFKENFGLNELLIGLCFLPNGLGTIVGSTIIGKLMTKDYKATEAEYKLIHNLPTEHKISPKQIPVDFPIEHARLKNLPWITVLFALSVGIYGWTLAFPSIVSLSGWIAVPLIFQFLIAATSNAVFALNQTLVSDLCPGKGASSTALNNLVRCGLAAVGVAFSETLIAAVGAGPAFTALALSVLACVPLAVINWYWGMEWRKRRVINKEREEQIKAGKA